MYRRTLIPKCDFNKVALQMGTNREQIFEYYAKNKCKRSCDFKFS